MKRFILSLIAMVILISCEKKSAPAEASEDVKIVVKAYFEGVKNRDLNAMNKVTTADFLLFEDGQIFNNDSLINFLNTFPSFSADFTLNNFRANVGEDIGNLSYYNRGELRLNDTSQVVYHWLESATFKKIDGEWKMDFLHSTIRK